MIDIGSISNARATAGARLHDAREAHKRAKKPEEIIIAEQNLAVATEEYDNVALVEQFAYKSLARYPLNIHLEEK